MTKDTFIKSMEDAWGKAQNLNCNKAVCFAQGAHESSWGNSKLFRFNNIFGIKASKNWKGEVTHIQGFEWNPSLKRMVPAMIAWRVYPSLSDCIMNYSQIINLNNCYRPALGYVDNPDQFLSVVAKHWATDPNYYHKVVGIGKEIERLNGPNWAKINEGR